MEEVQEQRYVCKICKKSCVSGKSLGGHMRVHMALISDSKKAAQAKFKSKMDVEGSEDQNGTCHLKKEGSKDQSNSAQISEEKIKNCEGTTDLGDGDQNNSYELRDNPKKSWRLSHSKHDDSKKAASCRECGKEFPSLRALSGHMRSHSLKNREVNQCKKCGKEFDSIRAMFGHMKSHSKKSRVPDESAEYLSDFENLCPIRRKRSRIKYNITPNPSFSSLNDASSGFSEFGEVEEVAMCLIMLSKGVKDWNMFDSVTEYSNDDYVYFGAQSACKSRRITDENDGDFVDGGDKSRSIGKVDDCVSGSANEFSEKNASEVDFVSRIFSDNDTKVNMEGSGDGLPSVDELKEPEQLNVSAVKQDFTDDQRIKFKYLGKDLLLVAGINEADYVSLNPKSCEKARASVHDSDLEKNSSENAAINLDVSKDSEKKLEYKCKTCGKISLSHKALRAHNARHKMQGNNSSVDMNTSSSSVTEADSKLDELNCNENHPEQESAEMGIVNLQSRKRKDHECPICFKVFSSGQALGGHKRAHFIGSTESKMKEAITVNQEITDNHDVFDLNFPATIDDAIKGDIGLKLWWVGNDCHEHEALVLTN